MRKLGLTVMFMLACAVAVTPASAQATQPAAMVIEYDIPPQPLEPALQQVADKAKLQLLYSPADVKGATTRGLKGKYSGREAIERLIEGTGLTASFSSNNAVAIRPRIDDRKSGGPGAASIAASGQSVPQETITVTAQKRSELILDVPVPVSVISADTLTRSGQLRLQDYYTRIPGLGLALVGNGAAPALSIRGISAIGTSNPAVGVMVDDVPYGSTVNPGTFPVVPDVDPGDLERVELLRGPQGTLYGASSMGGLLKFVTIDPSPDFFSGRFQAGVTHVSQGDDLGYAVRGAVNVPIGETLAVRLSGFSVRDAGYIDNALTGERDVNRRDAQGARVSALWKPTEKLSLKVSALVQDSDRLGPTDVNRALVNQTGQLLQRAPRKTGVYDRHTEAYSGTVVAAPGAVEITSVTGYNVDKIFSNLDASFFCAVVPCQALFGVTGAATPFHIDTKKFTQEIRAQVPIGKRIQWLVGGFYAKEDLSTELAVVAVDPATGAAAGTLLSGPSLSTFEEYAAFTNLTLNLTDRLDIQIGGRATKNELDHRIVRNPGPVFPNPVQPPTVQVSDSPFTYLVTPRFKFSPDLMVYARMASGYRPGGANNCSIPVPCSYGPDTTRNYEVGVKGSVLERTLSFDASLYRIDWRDIQVSVAFGGNPNLPFLSNAGRAVSQGIELSVHSRPLSGLTLSAWVVRGSAELDDDLPTTVGLGVGRKGDSLPNTSRVSASFTAEQRFSLWDWGRAFAAASVSYVGKREGAFRANAQAARPTFPSYVQVDLRAGVAWQKWAIDLFANNVTDKRALLTGDPVLNPNVVYTQPRTIGVSATRTF